MLVWWGAEAIFVFGFFEGDVLLFQIFLRAVNLFGGAGSWFCFA